jgi:two-component system NtrC family sensor kinase
MSSTCRKDDSVPVLVTEVATRPILVPRVIILDDDGDAWTPVIRAMRERGLGVLVGSANDSALDVVTACEAEVVILALGSPARAGLDFMARVKAASPDTEVILLAGDVSVEETIAAHRAGAYDVVRRPFQPCDLGPSILRAVEKRRQKREAAAVLREGQRLLSVREREQLPALAVEFTRRAMRADVVSLMLRDTSGRLYIAQAHGLPSEVLTGTRLHMGQRIAGRVAELRTPILLDDELFSDARFEDLAPFGRVQSSIIYPLLSGDRTIGVLNIGRSGPDGPFVRADLERAGVVASQIVLALETLKQWQRTGMTDRLAIVGQLAASVAHEINNPLAAVVGQNGLALDAVEDVLARLRSGAVPAAAELRTALLDIRSCLEDTRVAASALQAVASDLRTAIRGDATQAHTFEVAETVRGAVRLATAELKRQIAIVTDVEPRLFAAGDSGLLCQVFLNLVLNANQALRAAATPAPEIRIAARRVEGEVRIDVTDNGPGIALEDQRRIFEPFYPGSSAGARTGLGLSIVNDIVQGFGARIEVSSRLGEGTSFSVYLPEAPIAATSFVRGLEDTQPAGAVL